MKTSSLYDLSIPANNTMPIGVTVPKENLITGFLNDYKLGYPYAVNTMNSLLAIGAAIGIYLIVKK